MSNRNDLSQADLDGLLLEHKRREEMMRYSNITKEPASVETSWAPLVFILSVLFACVWFVVLVFNGIP